MIEKVPTGKIATTRHGVILLITSVMPVMAIISLVPVLPLLMREFGAVPGAGMLVPIMMTVPALCVALFSPIAGWIADRVGRKPLLLGALIAYAAFGVLPIFLNDLPQMIAARVALGIAESVIMTVATTLLGDYFQDERRERWFASQVAVVSISAIILIAIGGIFGELFGSRGPFGLYLLALPIALAAAIILFEPDVRRGTRGEAAAFPWARVLPPVLITLGVGLLFYTLMVQLGPILELSGVASPALIGAAGAAANLGMVVGSAVFGRLKQLAGPKLLALGLLVAATGYIGAGLFDNFLLVATSAVLACIGCGMLLPNMLTWTVRLLPASVRGRGTGIWTGAFFLGQFAAPIIAGMLSAPLGNLKDVLVLYAVLTTAGALATAATVRRKAEI
ncbi:MULTISPECIES: MFS transporter [unclassified Azospirillum]|uniref:MFS transporter n=1 Tax=unclassified Azospirillum TaxID=2630922 RepID=UPI000B654902|nr:MULTISPECIES: MFS transporter [unclassified Azospirillum]SNS92777.1 Predicted arabinose efflux permease, MFS family [Azospirillum sp. RU38E]SNT09644.1 Predicted arabinose efflux permease, MFS family [Azospirillum sp. RU37A]